jgi:hypothetical protein
MGMGMAYNSVQRFTLGSIGFDALPPLRYNGLMKWTRRIILGVVALFVLLAVFSIVAVGLAPSSGGRVPVEIVDEEPSPTLPNCSELGLPTPSGNWRYLGCIVETP